MKKVLITGITGQDGSHMIDYLLQNTSVDIYGAIRKLSNYNDVNLKHIKDNRFKIINLDITDSESVKYYIKLLKPDYFINFAAQSFVGTSWQQPILTFNTNTMPIIYILEAIREYCPNCRFYSAGSSEEFGNIDYIPQDLNHKRKPRSPYGASKCAAGHLVKVYRESYNLFAIHSILFNHEGTRRGKEFVTRKITSEMARIKHQLKNCERHGTIIKPLELGNIYVKRDWSDSEDFVEAIWLMLQRENPEDYLLASNEVHSVKEFIDLVCQYLKLETKWIIDDNNPLNNKLMCGDQVIIRINNDYYRPAEVDILCGDASDSYKRLNWQPKISFNELVKKMTLYDYENYNK